MTYETPVRGSAMVARAYQRPNRRPSVRGPVSQLERAERDGDGARVVASHIDQLGVAARSQRAYLGREVRAVGDRVSVERRHDVALLETRLVGAAAGRDLRDQRADDRALVAGRCGHRGAEQAVRALARLDDLLADAL